MFARRPSNRPFNTDAHVRTDTTFCRRSISACIMQRVGTSEQQQRRQQLASHNNTHTWQRHQHPPTAKVSTVWSKNRRAWPGRRPKNGLHCLVVGGAAVATANAVLVPVSPAVASERRIASADDVLFSCPRPPLPPPPTTTTTPTPVFFFFFGPGVTGAVLCPCLLRWTWSANDTNDDDDDARAPSPSCDGIPVTFTLDST